METCPCLKILKRVQTGQKRFRFSNLFAFTVCARLKNPKWNKKIKQIGYNVKEKRQDTHGNDQMKHQKRQLHKILRLKGSRQRLPKVVQVGLTLTWLTHQLSRHKKYTSKSL